MLKIILNLYIYIECAITQIQNGYTSTAIVSWPIEVAIIIVMASNTHNFRKIPSAWNNKNG